MTNTATSPARTVHIVICEDGRKRHEGSFATHDDAATFANWGHACGNGHKISRVPADSRSAASQLDISDCVFCADTIVKKDGQWVHVNGVACTQSLLQPR